MITSVLLTISVHVLLLNRLLSILAAYIGDTKLWPIVLAGLFGLVGVLLVISFRAINSRIGDLVRSVRPDMTEGIRPKHMKAKKLQKRKYEPITTTDERPAPPPSGKKLIIMGMSISFATAMICVLLFVVFNQTSKKFDDKFDFLSKNVNYNTQAIHDSLQQSQKLYTLQVDTNAKLNDCIRDWNNRFTTISNIVAGNKKTIEGFRDTIEKGLAQLAALVVDNSDAMALMNEKYNNLEIFVDDKGYQLALRIARAEGLIGLEPPFHLGSPVQITPLGHKYLQESGLNDLLAKYDSEITALAEERGVSSPEDIERAARYAVNTFEGWIEEAEKIDDYMLSHYDRKMFNIWEIGGIRFRDILMDRYGMQFPKTQEK